MDILHVITHGSKRISLWNSQLENFVNRHFSSCISLADILEVSHKKFYFPLALNHSKVKSTGKNNGFPFLDILGYLKNTNKNPKFGKVRQVPTREFLTKFPDWDLSHTSKFGIFVGILLIP